MIIYWYFHRFPLIWGLQLCHLLISDHLLSLCYFSVTSARSLCFWCLRSWDNSQVTNDDVCAHSSVLLPLSLTDLGNAMTPENQTLFFSFSNREEKHTALIWNFNSWFRSIFWLSQAYRKDKSLDMHLVL